MTTLIESKIRPPESQSRSVERPRVSNLLRELVSSYGFVIVTGSAGSGKTTAVLDAISDQDTPFAWLTLDKVDATPGRLLTYLEAALRVPIPEVEPAGTDALAADIGHVEAAGLLAQSLSECDLILVIDELERIQCSDEATEILAAFLRYLPPTVRVVLVSRRTVPFRPGSGRELVAHGHVDEEDLAFTVEEAEAALESFGESTLEAAAAVEATGGWVAGVLFEAWRSPEHVHGRGGEADPLNSYLATEIMSELSDAERDFLVETSLLEDITIERVEALGIFEGAQRMAAMRQKRLPVSFSADGLTMRCHTRFREYLRDLLQRSEPHRVTELTRAKGEILAREGHHEDAVDAFLAARDHDSAHSVVDEAVPAVLKRQDLEVIERWLAAFGKKAVEESETLTFAGLLLAIENEEWVHGAECADRLLTAKGTGKLDADLAVASATCFYQVSRLPDALNVIRRAPEVPQTEAVRFAIGVDLVGDPTHYKNRPPDSGNAAVDGMLARHDYAHGRFQRLLTPAERPSATTRAHEIAAMRGMGRLEEAQVRLQEADHSQSGWTITRIYAELMADLGRVEEARAALRKGRRAVDRSGPGFRMFELLLEAFIDLRFDRDVAAAEKAVAEVEAEPTASQRRRIVEQLGLLKGWAHLIERDDEAAATELRGCVEMMVEWDRLLFLPMAAVLLAEAEWRLGHEDRADEAADIALAATQAMGSDHPLLVAAQEYPAIVARRLDAEAEVDSPWHDLGRKLMSSGRTSKRLALPRVKVREFGESALLVDGVRVDISLTKSIEILAYLAINGGSASKRELLSQLFTSRSEESARSYLRQALDKLQKALPGDASLLVDQKTVRWQGRAGLGSDSIQLGEQLKQAQSQQGRDLIEAVTAALAVADGEYLPGLSSAWVDERRREIEAMINDAKHLAARAAFEIGNYGAAETLLQEVLDIDPYRESSWRLSMRIAAALGDDDQVIARYRLCSDALQGINVDPAVSTQQLVEILRR